MKDCIFCVRDCVADRFIQPFLANNIAVAIRMFNNSCNDSGSLMGQNPADFDLYQLGEFDHSDGKITLCEPVIIKRGTDYAV